MGYLMKRPKIVLAAYIFILTKLQSFRKCHTSTRWPFQEVAKIRKRPEHHSQNPLKIGESTEGEVQGEQRVMVRWNPKSVG